jgi:oligopeptide/dipeptide ABC transporter ATP-binding protein
LKGALLEVRGLSARYDNAREPQRPVRALDDIDLEIATGETLGLVGESGCGKSTLAYSLLCLLPSSGRIVKGEVLWKGRDLIGLPEEAIRQVRGKEIAMIFQNPAAALNPVLNIGTHVAEPLRVHRGMGREQAWREALDLLAAVGISDPAVRARDYPHQMSGGMKQRVSIAMAIACSPDLLIADEPTSALDVTVQSQILELLERLKEELGLAMLLVSHDLGVVAQHADRVAVMYAGRIVEQAPVAGIFHDPKHPYTNGLLSSLAEASESSSKQKLPGIRGSMPDLAALSPGCAFAPRCPVEVELCQRAIPPLLTVSTNHLAACYAYPEVAAAIHPHGSPSGDSAPAGGLKTPTDAAGPHPHGSPSGDSAPAGGLKTPTDAAGPHPHR